MGYAQFARVASSESSPPICVPGDYLDRYGSPSSETHPFEVHVQFGLPFADTVTKLWQRDFIAFCQFLYALGELLADATHLAVDCCIERDKPFVIHQQRLNLSLSEPRVVSV